MAIDSREFRTLQMVESVFQCYSKRRFASRQLA